MSKIAESSPGDVLAAAVMLVLFAGCAAAWTMIAVRWRRRQPLLPYEPRRPVPWRGADALLVLVVYVVLPALVAQALSPWFPAAAAEGEGKRGQAPFVRSTLRAVPANGACPLFPSGRVQPGDKAPRSRPAARQEVSTEHPLGRLLEKSDSRLAILMGGMIAMVIAPLVEELLLRLTVQGWLEAAERRWRRRAAWLRRCLPGVIPVAVVSLCFAALHIRVAAPAEELPSVALVAAQAIGNLATIGLTVLWLRLGAGATLSDLGIVPGLWRKDVVIGLVAFAAVTAPILVFFAAIKQLAPTVVLDPLPIFLLAIVLGLLYYRTHRILPSIVLHAAFNATSVLIALTAR